MTKEKAVTFHKALKQHASEETEENHMNIISGYTGQVSNWEPSTRKPELLHDEANC
jgi:hypothetical protein